MKTFASVPAPDLSPVRTSIPYVVVVVIVVDVMVVVTVSKMDIKLYGYYELKVYKILYYFYYLI